VVAVPPPVPSLVLAPSAPPEPPAPVAASEPVAVEFGAVVALVLALPSVLAALVGVAPPFVAVAPGPLVALPCVVDVDVDGEPSEPEVAVSSLLDEASSQPARPSERPSRIETARRFAPGGC
jgi:hypothetical protein